MTQAQSSPATEFYLTTLLVAQLIVFFFFAVAGHQCEICQLKYRCVFYSTTASLLIGVRTLLPSALHSPSINCCR